MVNLIENLIFYNFILKSNNKKYMLYRFRYKNSLKPCIFIILIKKIKERII